MLSPSRPTSFLDRLAFWAEQQPRKLALVYLADGEQAQERLDYGALFSRIKSQAAWLSERVPPGERALVAAHSEIHYLLGLLACLQADVIAIPTLTTVNARALERIQAHGEDAGACALLADPWMLERRDRNVGSFISKGAWIHGIPWLNLEDSIGHVGQSPAIGTMQSAEDNRDQRPAYLQYTSGSTSRPKGVVVTHANLAAQLGCLETALAHKPGSVVCNWMPLFHDFGLIMSLQALYSGGTVVLMPAVPAVQRPRRWLQAISDYRAVTSAAPNFMFDRCVERIPAAEFNGLDLSSLRNLLNAAEPIQPATLRSFAQYFHPVGFQQGALMPAYGLAEATLLATAAVSGTGFVIETFDADALLEQRASKSLANLPGKELVGCGISLANESVRIVDPETCQQSLAGAIGEVWLCSPSVAAGYWERPNESVETFGARIKDQPGSPCHLRTGDLGFLWEDQLYIVGRLKDLVIVRGENHYPQDIELTVALSHPHLEPNAGAAFAIDAPGGERLVIVQEVRREVLQRIVPEELFAAIRHAVAEVHGLETAHIVLLRPTGLPRTSSGKVQRRPCRLAWQESRLSILAEWATPQQETATPESNSESLESEILAICQRLLPNASINLEQSLFDYGVDSLKAVEILLELEERWNTAMDLADFARNSSVSLLASAIRSGQHGSLPDFHKESFFRGDDGEVAGNEQGARELTSQILHYVAAWEGTRCSPDSLLVGLNTTGKKAPLFWVFQGQQEFAALADRLGPDQPVFGLRSGHQVMDYSETNIQILATSYRREISEVWPQGPYFLGGNCQGGLIALAIAQQFWRLQQPVALLALLEWAFPPQPYQGRVALMWGESSTHKNPFFKFHEPALYWRRAFGNHSVDIISGGHGEFFIDKNIGVLADTLKARIMEASEVEPLLLPMTAFQAGYRALDIPTQMAPSKRHCLKVEVRNLSPFDWAATEKSGLQLANHWHDSEGKTIRWLDGVTPLPRTPAGATVTVNLSIIAPREPGDYLLALDIVEEGICWFSERAVTSLKCPVRVVKGVDDQTTENTPANSRQ